MSKKSSAMRFRRFDGQIAVFEINGKKTTLDRKSVRELHEGLKKHPSKKGTTPAIEQTKFALDRWPGTELEKRIRKLQ